MKSFEDYNPIAVFISFALVTLVTMLCMNPVILVLSLFGAVTFSFVRAGGFKVREHAFYLAVLAVVALVNPIFNHNGATALFVLNNNLVTLEAALYGVAAGAMIVAILYWFRSFSVIMTSDKLLYVFGSFLPKVSLILSMTLRYIPLFKKQQNKTRSAQKALGLSGEDNIIDRVRGGMRVFSVMVTWALENGIITADSMYARGYGVGKRTRFALYRFRKDDVILIFTVTALSTAVFAGIALGALDFNYYPYFSVSKLSALGAVSYSAYAALSLMPSIIQVKGRIKWKYLQSKI